MGRYIEAYEMCVCDFVYSLSCQLSRQYTRNKLSQNRNAVQHGTTYKFAFSMFLCLLLKSIHTMMLGIHRN